MAIMNAIAYKRINQIFEGKSKMQNLVQGVKRLNFHIYEREDGKLLAVWGKSDDELTYMDFYVCDGAEVSDVFNTPFYMETAPMTRKLITLQGDFAGITKACNCFSMYGKSFVCLIEAGRYNPTKPIDLHLYSKPALAGSFSKVFTKRIVDTPSSWYGGGGTTYSTTRLGGVAHNGRGMIFMPFGYGGSTSSRFGQIHSLDSGNSWNFKPTHEEVTDLNWGILNPSGKKFDAIWTGDRFLMTMMMSSIGDSYYVMESFDGINWTNHNIRECGDISDGYEMEIMSYDKVGDYLYMSVPKQRAMYRRPLKGTTTENMLVKSGNEYLSMEADIKTEYFGLTDTDAYMHYLEKTGYLTTVTLRYGEGVEKRAKMLFRW